jgi:hypothetical protein
VGVDRADVVVTLQTALMRAAHDFGEASAFRPHAARVLATAAALDYVLLLARGAAGVTIAEDEAERAIHAGIARGVDDLILAADAIASVRSPAATAFAHETAKSLRAVLGAEDLGNDERTFALIALANA